MKKPLIQSLVFHLVVVLLLIISNLSFFSRKDTETKITPITVELLPIGEKTNVKPAPKRQPTPPKPVPKQPEKKPEPKKPEPKKPEPKPQPKPDSKPTPKKLEPKKPEPEKKAEKKPEKKPQKETPEDSAELNSLLNDLDKTKPTPQETTNMENSDENSKSTAEFDPKAPLTVAEIDYIKGLIMRQIIPCWNVPAGAMNARTLKIKLDVDVGQDGTMKFAGFTEEALYNSDSYYQVAADSARRAVLDPRCNPLQELPPMDKFHQWHELTLTFDPKDLIH